MKIIKNVAFAQFENEEEIESGIMLNESDLGGNTILINKVDPEDALFKEYEMTFV